MSGSRGCHLRRPALLALSLVAAGSAVADPPAAAPAPPADLTTLGRVLKHFDFEEAEVAPYEMPNNFYRYIAPDQGFPQFGSMKLSRTAARSGRWSFLFEVDGGSLSARVPTAVIPILPGGDYVVTAWVRTEQLAHAAAQVAAQVYDIEHNPIAESRAASPPMQTGGRWRQVAIEIHGDDDHAADLVLELLVLQPEQHGGRAGQPKLDDVSGRVWFDEVTVRQEPRIEISTGVPGNVIAAPDTPVLDFMIRDATAEDLTARVTVEDIDGREIHAETHDLPRGVWRHTLPLGDVDAGWYRVWVDVRNDRQRVGTGTLDLAVVGAGASPHRDGRLGVVLAAPATAEAVERMHRLVGLLGVPGTVLPIPRDTVALGPDGLEAFRRAGERLLGRGAELTIALPALSGTLMSADHLDSRSVRELIGSEEGLTDMLMTFGLAVPRWLLTPGIDDAAAGPDLGSAVLLSDERLRSMVEGVAGALADFVPDPVVLVPWSAEYDLAPLPAPHGYWIDVPTFIGPEVFAEYAAQWPIGGRSVYTTIERLDAAEPPDQQVTDLMLRALWGWRVGLPHMAITSPWSRRGPRGSVVPDPVFPVWRALADRLDGRRFAGVLPVGPGIRCWVLNGDTPGDTTLVAWNEKAPPDEAALSMLLADDAVEVVDAFGNRRRTPPVDGAQHVPLGARPVFIEGVDAQLVQFRAGFRISPEYLTARHQVHEGDLLLSNPWTEAISGTVRLRPPDGWRISPRIHTFAIPAGGSVKLPISLIFTQRLLTGPGFAEAEVEVVADRRYTLRLRAPLEVGVQDLEFVAWWHPDADSTDLLITQSVTNTGDEAITLAAFVSAPGLSRQRRSIGPVVPGQTATCTFRLADGARLLSGRSVRVGMVTDEGARLNRVLEIPETSGVAR